MDLYSLYLHIPFCIHRCGYCDFNTYAGLQDLIPAYVRALCLEMEQVAAIAPERLRVHTVFFGGGTPSLLPIDALERILSTARLFFDFVPQPEITLEANPGTLSPEYLRQLHLLGVNRLSLGVQSANPGELRLLERQHDYPDVIHAVTWARQAGFDNLNLDLIFGLPEQRLETWQHTLELVLGLRPEHFSLYALSLEHGTPFGKWAARGQLSVPDPDTAAEMYEWASERLESAGYGQYEISNWAKLSQGEDSSTLQLRLACRHNLQYWLNQPYLGVGAGAHGYAGGVRTANVLGPQAYIRRISGFEEPGIIDSSKAARQVEGSRGFPATGAIQDWTVIDRQAEIGETMMMGLRLTRTGVADSAFRQRFGSSLEETFGPQIERLMRVGLLENAGTQGDLLRLTTRGRLLGNQVFVEFI
jgi:oxygen-independent coproporphyrinogen III oxidase